MDVDGLLEAACRLVRVPSWNGDESAAQELVAELMTASGLDVDLWEIDLASAQAHPDCSWEIPRGRALGLVGTLPGAEGPELVLNGHVDVVPPGDERLWTDPPFAGVVRDGRLRGRGSLDMKGQLMAGLFALAAIRSAGVRLSGTTRLQSVIGEEDGGIGTLATILRGYRGDGAIVLEPTRLAVVPLQAGCLNFRVHVPGRAAHGAVRDEGVSAFEKLFGVYAAVADLERLRNDPERVDPLLAGYRLPFPISVGTMRGGDWASSVPDHAVMEGRLGVRPDEDLGDAREALERCVRDAALADDFLADHPPRVEWWGGRFLPAATDPDDPVVRCLGDAATAVLGEAPCVSGVPFGSDAGLLRNVAGVPTVLFGAGDIRNAHRPDESVGVDELVALARILAVTAVRFCGAERA